MIDVRVTSPSVSVDTWKAITVVEARAPLQDRQPGRSGPRHAARDGVVEQRRKETARR
jgi:hypothetical protein